MKKLVLALVMVTAIGFTFTACKGDKKADAQEEVKGDTASTDEVYQCPMDCEHGKSYTEAGKCPKCNMDLKAHKAGEGDATHSDACTCKSGGECTCAEGECKCSDKADATCEKCGPDKECTCHKDGKKHADASCEKCGEGNECTCPKEDKA